MSWIRASSSSSSIDWTGLLGTSVVQPELVFQNGKDGVVDLIVWIFFCNRCTLTRIIIKGLTLIGTFSSVFQKYHSGKCHAKAYQDSTQHCKQFHKPLIRVKNVPRGNVVYLRLKKKNYFITGDVFVQLML
jgi:hypothetical protein